MSILQEQFRKRGKRTSASRSSTRGGGVEEVAYVAKLVALSLTIVNKPQNLPNPRPERDIGLHVPSLPSIVTIP